MHAYRSALVTGVSSGIGAAIARQIAAAGGDVVIVARRADRLEALAGELRDTHGVQVEVLVADLTDPEERERVERRLADRQRPVELLVNNAGVSTEGEFASCDVDEEEREIRLNVVAPVRLTRAVLPLMTQRGHGGVLNVSSVAGQMSMPGLATYNATKAYVNSFSESLHMEGKPYGVHVTALLPGFTRTEFVGQNGSQSGNLPEFAMLDAELVARAGLRAVSAGEAVCVPSLQYAGASALLSVLPRGLVRRVVPRVWRRL